MMEEKCKTCIHKDRYSDTYPCSECTYLKAKVDYYMKAAEE